MGMHGRRFSRQISTSTACNNSGSPSAVPKKSTIKAGLAYSVSMRMWETSLMISLGREAVGRVVALAGGVFAGAGRDGITFSSPTVPIAGAAGSRGRGGCMDAEIDPRGLDRIGAGRVGLVGGLASAGRAAGSVSFGVGWASFLPATSPLSSSSPAGVAAGDSAARAASSGSNWALNVSEGATSLAVPAGIGFSFGKPARSPRGVSGATLAASSGPGAPVFADTGWCVVGGMGSVFGVGGSSSSWPTPGMSGDPPRACRRAGNTSKGSPASRDRGSIRISGAACVTTRVRASPVASVVDSRGPGREERMLRSEAGGDTIGIDRDCSATGSWEAGTKPAGSVACQSLGCQSIPGGTWSNAAPGDDPDPS